MLEPPAMFLFGLHAHTHTPIFSAIFHPLYFYGGLFFAGVGVGQSIVQDKEGRAQAQPLLGNRAADVGVEMNGYSRFQCFLGFLKSARHLWKVWKGRSLLENWLSFFRWTKWTNKLEVRFFLRRHQKDKSIMGRINANKHLRLHVPKNYLYIYISILPFMAYILHICNKTQLGMPSYLWDSLGGTWIGTVPFFIHQMRPGASQFTSTSTGSTGSAATTFFLATDPGTKLGRSWMIEYRPSGKPKIWCSAIGLRQHLCLKPQV